MPNAQRISYLLVILAVLLLVPFMDSGFKVDDFMYLNQARDTAESGDLSTVFEMWNITDSTQFADFKEMWWAHPEFQMKFLRPSGAMLFHFHARVFGDNAAAYYVIPLVLVICLMLVWRRFCLTLLPPATALLALLFVALHHSLASSYLWISNNHQSLIPILLAWFSILCFLHWRRSQSRPALGGHILMATISVACGELALGTLSSLYFYEFFVLGSRGRALVKPLLPLTVILTTYVLFYKFMGYGVRASEMYINPFASLATLTTELPQRLALALTALWGMGTYNPQIYPKLYYAIAFLAAMAAWWGMIYQRMTRNQRSILLYSTFSTMIAIGPGLLASPGDRILLPSIIFASITLALLIVHSYSLLKLMNRGISQALLATVLIAMLSIQLIYQPKYTLFRLSAEMNFHTALLEQVSKSFPTGVLSGSSVVFLNTPISFYAFYGSNIAHYKGLPFPDQKQFLTVCQNPLSFTRLDQHTLRLEVPGDFHLFSCPLAQLVTTRLYLQKRNNFANDVYTASIIERSNGYPSVVDFRFHQSLDDPNLALLYFWKGKLEHAQLQETGDIVQLY
jgi:hypothetical protein